MKKLTKLWKSYKKIKTFSLLSVVQSQGKDLTAMVLSIINISKDSIKNKNRLYLFKNLFILLPQVTWKINCQNFTFIRNILPNKLGNPESIKNQPW